MRDTHRHDLQLIMRVPILVTLVAVLLAAGLSRPSSVAAQAYVIDYSAGTGGNGALFRIDPTTGARTLLSDFGMGANPGVDPYGVAVEAWGSLLVSDYSAGTGGNGALFRIDPTTGARTLLSDFGVGANPGAGPMGVAIGASVDLQASGAGPGPTLTNPVTVTYTLQGCSGKELYLVVNAPAMGMPWSYLSATGWLPLPTDLSTLTPWGSGSADGIYTLYADTAPQGTYELYLGCDNVADGHLNIDTTAGLNVNGVYDYLAVTVSP